MSLVRVLLLALASSAVVAIRSSGVQAAKQKPDAVDTLVDWLHKRDGEAYVRATVHGSVTGGLTASKAVQPGSPIAIIPFKACYELPEGVSGVQDAALAVAPDIADAKHGHSAMWSTLVQPKEARASFYTFPPEYLPLLQAPALSEYVTKTQTKTAGFWKEHQKALEAKGVTRAQFLELVHVISTRYFEHEGGFYLVPLMDLASHDGQCPHYIDLSACPDPKGADADEEANFASADDGKDKPQCIYWRAGVALSPGDPLCTNFGALLNDRSLLQFGILVDDGPGETPELFGVDRRDFNPKTPWNDMYVDALETTDGDATVISTERDRLKAIRRTLKKGDKAAADAKAVASDKGGALLADVRRWRALRMKAVESELARVEAWARGERPPPTGAQPKAGDLDDDDQYDDGGGADASSGAPAPDAKQVEL